MKYICYCDQVTEQDVLDAIGNGARTVRQVCQMTGAMTHCDCKNKHPNGTCCSADILHLLKKQLAAAK